MAERKKYIEVKVPLLNSNIRVLGTPKELDKRTIKLDLSRKMRGKGIFVKFRIFLAEKELVAVPNRLEISTNYIRKIMRKRTSYVEDSFNAKCSDIRARVKPILITRKKVSRAVRKNLRNTAREFLLEYLSKKDFCEAFSDVLNGELQKSMLPRLKKIYPLSFCDIRILETKDILKIDLEKILKEDEPEKEAEKEDD